MQGQHVLLSPNVSPMGIALFVPDPSLLRPLLFPVARASFDSQPQITDQLSFTFKRLLTLSQTVPGSEQLLAITLELRCSRHLFRPAGLVQAFTISLLLLNRSAELVEVRLMKSRPLFELDLPALEFRLTALEFAESFFTQLFQLLCGSSQLLLLSCPLRFEVALALCRLGFPICAFVRNSLSQFAQLQFQLGAARLAVSLEFGLDIGPAIPQLFLAGLTLLLECRLLPSDLPPLLLEDAPLFIKSTLLRLERLFALGNLFFEFLGGEAKASALILQDRSLRGQILLAAVELCHLRAEILDHFTRLVKQLLLANGGLRGFTFRHGGPWGVTVGRTIFAHGNPFPDSDTPVSQQSLA
jgi:hypothetical protein